MASASTDRSVAPRLGAQVRSAKIVVAGSFGVGKTTFVGAVSEIPPLTTEASMTTASVGIDDASQVAQKTTTTVAMDFGRITIDETVVLYVFGTPGQARFSFMWDDIAKGSLFAVVMADTRRLDECYPAVDYFELRSMPFIIAVNEFDGAQQHDMADIREALDLGPDIPVIAIDARRRESAKLALITGLEYLLRRIAHESRVTRPAPHLD